MNENELIKNIITGDKKSFNTIFETYKEYSYKISFHIVQNSEDALDNVNNSWIKVYSALMNNKFKFESKFSTWLYRIVVNEALTLLKSRKREISINADEFDESKIMDVRSLINKIEDKSDKELRLNKIMNSLNPRQQQIVSLLIEGYKFNEIAMKLNIKTNHLYQLTSRIKKILKDVK
jgi:RNA polymerase sigma-70 factor (ECF subfamily)